MMMAAAVALHLVEFLLSPICDSEGLLRGL